MRARVFGRSVAHLQNVQAGRAGMGIAKDSADLTVIDHACAFQASPGALCANIYEHVTAGAFSPVFSKDPCSKPPPGNQDAEASQRPLTAPSTGIGRVPALD